MRFVVIFLVVALTSGCSNYSAVPARFVVYNNATNTNFTMRIVIDGKEYGLVVPGRSSTFTIELDVPDNFGNQSYGPSPLDKQVRVSVAFINTFTNQQTVPVFCYAGAKLTTTVVYEEFSGRPNISCSSS